ncbi:MAG: hypothetical protein H7099_19145 [Gemmatimonadaceae bacterium]|nr:hypothetical protein [Gemmatimonadaceae bacterium]
MTDATRLTTLLQEYATALAEHLGLVRDEYARLEQAWRMLSDRYEGAGAEQFRTVFVATSRRMQAYEHDGSLLLGVLRRRIEALMRFDAESTQV